MALLFLLGIVASAIRAADYVEITTDLNATWAAQTITNHHNITARCLIGTNGWFISGNFLANAEINCWLVDTNVIEQRTITSSMYFQQAKDFVSEQILRQKSRSPLASSYPRAGEKYTIVHPAPQGQPAGEGMANVVWLAFCSGRYLKQNGRQVPMPIGMGCIVIGLVLCLTLRQF